MRSLIALLGLLALASAQANVFFNYDGIGDLEYRPFTDTTPLNVYVSLRSYLCTASSCADKTCSHLYCATDSTGKCTTVRFDLRLRFARFLLHSSDTSPRAT